MPVSLVQGSMAQCMVNCGGVPAHSAAVYTTTIDTNATLSVRRQDLAPGTDDLRRDARWSVMAGSSVEGRSKIDTSSTTGKSIEKAVRSRAGRYSPVRLSYRS